MDFQKSSLKSRKIKLESGRNLTDYPHTIQLYSEPPQTDISLQQFEDYAVERLKVLKAVESVGIRHVKGSVNYKEALEKELKQICTKQNNLPVVLKRSSDGLHNDADYGDRQKDHISHFILRLAYCKSEELRRWFVAQELDLFRYRFGQENQTGIKEFLELNNLHYKPIPESEKNELKEYLVASCSSQHLSMIDQMHFYKVKFTEALELVRSRKVYLADGYAYVPHQDLVVIIVTLFRARLSRDLSLTARHVPNLDEDRRLLPMLGSLSKRYLGADYGSNKKIDASAITADMIDQLSVKSFPPCMQQLQQGIKRDHHLKHGGRQQYGLFLKGIGLPLQEALKFWRSSFSKNTDPDKFDKQYSYNIRHNYGQEGKRTNYTPYSCIKIITSNTPTVGDHHGCPFKHTDVDLLKQRLQGQSSLPKTGVDEVVDYVKKGHFQIACGRYFDLVHKNEGIETTINHPNQYFEESQKHIGGDKTPSSAKKTATKVIRVSSQQANSQTSNASQPSQTQKTDMSMDYDDDDDDELLASMLSVGESQ